MHQLRLTPQKLTTSLFSAQHEDLSRYNVGFQKRAERLKLRVEAAPGARASPRTLGMRLDPGTWTQMREGSSAVVHERQQQFLSTSLSKQDMI